MTFGAPQFIIQSLKVLFLSSKAVFAIQSCVALEKQVILKQNLGKSEEVPQGSARLPKNHRNSMRI